MGVLILVGGVWFREGMEMRVRGLMVGIVGVVVGLGDMEMKKGMGGFGDGRI